MDFRLVRGDKSDRAQFCSKISWDFDTERGRLAFVARLIGLANETECRIIGAVDDKLRRLLFCVSRSDLRNLSSQTLQHYHEISPDWLKAQSLRLTATKKPRFCEDFLL